MPRGIKGSGKKAVATVATETTVKPVKKVRRTTVKAKKYPKVAAERQVPKCTVEHWERVKFQSQLIQIVEDHFKNLDLDLANFDAKMKDVWGQTLAINLLKTAVDTIKDLDLFGQTCKKATSTTTSLKDSKSMNLEVKKALEKNLGTTVS